MPLYYHVKIRDVVAPFFIVVSRELGGRIKGFEVNLRGERIRDPDGNYRTRVVDRTTAEDLVECRLRGGRVIPAPWRPSGVD